MKDEDDLDTEWTFQVGVEEVAQDAVKYVAVSDAENVLDTPPAIPVKATPIKAKPVIEKKSTMAGKSLLDLGDIDNSTKLELDRRPNKVRGNEYTAAVQKEAAMQIEAIKNMKAEEDTFEHAPVVRRVVAQFIDILVIFLIFVVSAYFVPFGVNVTKGVLKLINLEHLFNNLTAPLFVQLTFIFIGIYIVFVIFLSATTTTVGKKIMGLEIRDIDRPSITISQAFLREMIFKPLSIISIFGILYIFLNKERKTLHDILSSTLVVSKK